MRDGRVRQITTTGVLAALIFVATFFFHVPTGLNGGYVHFGDALVYIAAAVLPMPYAMAASAIGAGLSDLMSPGGAIWILPTILIKPLCCLAFTNRKPTLLCRRNVVALFVAGAITMLGYFLAGWVIGGFGAAVAELAFGWVQPAGSAICFVVCAILLDRIHVKQALSESMGGVQQ